jgi:hypothetical protein
LDIDGWLRGIGLAQYAEILRTNDIDGELLGRLTNDDLKEIGVASFGHRKKLLEAIAKLGSAPAAGPAATAMPTPVAGWISTRQSPNGRTDSLERQRRPRRFTPVLGASGALYNWQACACKLFYALY